MREYMIVFDGIENMGVAEKFLNGSTCRSMTYGSDYLGQMEIDYNHGVAKVKYVTEDMLVFTVNSLENMGINGVVCIKCEAEFDGVSIEEPGWYFALKVGNSKTIKKHMYQIALYRGAELSTMKIEEEPKEAMRIVTHKGTKKGVTEALLTDCETGEILCQLCNGLITYVSGVGNSFKGKAFYEQ